MCEEARTVTKGAGGEAPLAKILVSPGKSIGQNLKLLVIVQKFLAPLRKLFAPLGVQTGYMPERSVCEKEALLPKKCIFGTNAPS